MGLNEDNFRLKFGKELLEKATSLDNSLKSSGDTIKQEGFDRDFSTFETDYLNALNWLVSIQEAELETRETLVRAIRGGE
jgi:hypothetical protein